MQANVAWNWRKNYNKLATSSPLVSSHKYWHFTAFWNIDTLSSILNHHMTHTLCIFHIFHIAHRTQYHLIGCHSFQFHSFVLSVTLFLFSIVTFSFCIFFFIGPNAVKMGFPFQKKKNHSRFAVNRSTHARAHTLMQTKSKHETDTLHRNNNKIIGLLLLPIQMQCNAFISPA